MRRGSVTKSRFLQNGLDDQADWLRFEPQIGVDWAVLMRVYEVLQWDHIRLDLQRRCG